MGLLCEVDVADWGLPPEYDYSIPLAEFVENVVSIAQDLCPVRTGFLRSTIGDGAFVGQTSASIPVSCEYAQYVEYGTYKMEAQPYFEPAIEIAMVELVDACCEIAGEERAVEVEEELEAEIEEAEPQFAYNDNLAEEEDNELATLYAELAELMTQIFECEDEEEAESIQAEMDAIEEEIAYHEEERAHRLDQANEAQSHGSLLLDILAAIIMGIIMGIMSGFVEAISYDDKGSSIDIDTDLDFECNPNYDVSIF